MRQPSKDPEFQRMHPLVILPGALLAPPETLLERLRRRRPVRVIAYPPQTTMTALVDSIAAQLGEQGIEHCDLLGFSYGAWVGQCLRNRYPNLVRDLVLVHGFALRPQHAWLFRIGLRVWRWMPTSSFRRMARKRIARILKPLRKRDDSEYARVLAAVDTRLGQAETPPALIRQNECMLESCTNFAAANEHRVHPGRRVLIIDSDNDPVVPRNERAHLRALHPDAWVHSFPGAGHIAPWVEPHAFADTVERFLER